MAEPEPDNLFARQTPAPLVDLTDDRAQLYDILTRTGLQGRDAHIFTKLVEEMASTNLIHRFENKLEAQNAKLDAQTKALSSQLRFIQWAIGIGVAILAPAGLTPSFSKGPIVSRASANLIHRFESKLDAQTAALSSQLRFIQWAIGIGVAILVAGGAYAVFF